MVIQRLNLSGILLVLLCLQAGLCSPYEWSQPVSPSVLAPSDSVERTVRGASLQGSLVDLRWGQVCVDVGGTGHLLDWNKQSEFTLNGTKATPEDLAKLVKTGESVMVALRYNPESGAIGWLDALTQKPQAAIHLDIEPYYGPAMKAGQSLSIVVPLSEWRRLKLTSKATLLAPGMAHQLKFEDRKAELPLMEGWNWKDIPLYVLHQQKAFRGKSLSISTDGPQITGFGPDVAPGLERILCWVDIVGSKDLLSLQDCQVSSTFGSTVTQRVLRDGRLSFFLQVEGPGTYEIKVSLTDQLDREATASWVVDVRP